MIKTTTRNPRNRGFTLIELSIVLVIIGLIVGGILVGQSLIHGAEIRAAVSQIEKYDAAANTFRNKYHGLPGDVLNPANFGFDANFNAGFPNGNGLIAGFTVNDADDFNEEIAAFFRHLSQANLIPDAIIGTDFLRAGPENSAGGVADYAPISAMDASAFIIVAANLGLNYYTIASGNPTFIGNGRSEIGFNDGLETNVIDAFQMDTKLDDGVATTGRVRAVTDFATADANTDCHTSGVYNTADSPDAITCTLQIRASF